jgi:hypothetical protein
MAGDIACGHQAPAFGSPVCVHLRTCTTPWLSYVKWYTGRGLEVELLCQPCANARDHGQPVMADWVCEPCFQNVTEEVGDLNGVRGRAEIRVRREPFAPVLVETILPAGIGGVTDFAPLGSASVPSWLLLLDDGALLQLDPRSLECSPVAQVTVPPEPEREPWCQKVLRRHLHVSSRGEFAAVVNDFGRWGQVVDLRSGQLTMSLDGGTYHPETVPFSFAFVDRGPLTLAIHRTAWNRLDISDPVTGASLSDRSQPPASEGDRPVHHLDYFHGALLPDPSSARIIDGGWVWHPVGMPTAWSLDRWFDNVWESEDGPSRIAVCARSYYWNAPMVWLDDDHVAIGGIGDDDNEMIDGARVFDVTTPGKASPAWNPNFEWARERNAFAGPGGLFFSDGRWLFSSDQGGLSRWDPVTGERTGQLTGFRPSRHHRTARELAELRDGRLVRLILDP